MYLLLKYLIIILLLLNSCGGEKNLNKRISDIDFNNNERYLRFVFYNVENYFDIYNDSLKRDDDFTPTGNYYWTYKKYKEKQRKIYQVIAAIGGWELPEIIAFCEIENRFVLQDLINSTALKYHNYDIIHQDSPDRRGIDVALLYSKNKLELLYNDFFKIVFPFDTTIKTRDILYASLLTLKHDTLHVFINHWPSRMGGQSVSEERRNYVAYFLRTKIDSLFNINPNSNILVSGDFNDEPDNISITNHLKANTDVSNPIHNELYNLSWLLKRKNKGSHKFQGEWSLIDQVIVSGNLLNTNNSIYTTINHTDVFNPDFLSEKDETYMGLKPFRTYIGFKYNGGFSDHYPIFIDFLDN